MRAIGLARVAGFYGLMTAVAVVILWHTQALHLLAPPLAAVEAWLTQIGIGTAAGLAVVGLCFTLLMRFTWAVRLAVELHEVLGPTTPREALALATLSAVGEEVLFRGLLQPHLGLWATSALFDVLHIGPNRHFAPWTVMAFLAGLGFGGLFEYYGTLLAPIFAHGTINFINLSVLLPSQHRAVTARGRP